MYSCHLSVISSASVRSMQFLLPISQSRGRIPIVAQNSEEESPLSPVGQPMGMARAAAGPLPPISADTRDQFGSSHSLPEVQQHMREESRTRGYNCMNGCLLERRGFSVFHLELNCGQPLAASYKKNHVLSSWTISSVSVLRA